MTDLLPNAGFTNNAEPETVGDWAGHTATNRYPFTRRELFGNEINGAELVQVCIECGALVQHPVTHTSWHNKVADL